MVTYKKRQERTQENIESPNILPAVPAVIELKLTTDRRFVHLRMWISDIIPSPIMTPQPRSK